MNLEDICIENFYSTCSEPIQMTSFSNLSINDALRIIENYEILSRAEIGPKLIETQINQETNTLQICAHPLIFIDLDNPNTYPDGITEIDVYRIHQTLLEKIGHLGMYLIKSLQIGYIIDSNEITFVIANPEVIYKRLVALAA